VLEYPGIYEIWCGSDELGWYQPYEWHQLTEIWPPDYGLGADSSPGSSATMRRLQIIVGMSIGIVIVLLIVFATVVPPPERTTKEPQKKTESEQRRGAV
jgi:hypothetical protein